MAVVAHRVQSLDIVNLDAADALQYQHAASGIVPVYLWNVEVAFAGKVGAEAVGVAPLTAVIQFGPHSGGKVLRYLWHVVEFAQRGTCLKQTGQVEEDFQIGFNSRLNVWPLHFDDHIRAIRQCGSVHLGQRWQCAPGPARRRRWEWG